MKEPWDRLKGCESIAPEILSISVIYIYKWLKMYVSNSIDVVHQFKRLDHVLPWATASVPFAWHSASPASKANFAQVFTTPNPSFCHGKRATDLSYIHVRFKYPYDSAFTYRQISMAWALYAQGNQAITLFAFGIASFRVFTIIFWWGVSNGCGAEPVGRGSAIGGVQVPSCNALMGSNMVCLAE